MELREQTRKKPGIVYLLALVAVVLLLFCCLYHPFLIGGELYAYDDIGSDTIRGYLPNMIYDLHSFESGMTDMYRLDKGLGEYYPSLLYKYVNLVNLPILLLGEANLNWGILLATLLKYLTIAIFSWLFFRRLFEREWVSMLCAVLWTYAGYGVLWGQHYHLLTSIAAFTIELYGLQLFLENHRRWYLFILTVACMAYTGYYYLWMGVFFLVGYALCYLIFHRASFGKILGLGIMGAFCILIGVLIAGEYMLPNVLDLMDSTRIDVIAGEEFSGLLYTPDYLASLFARLLSTNLLGVGSQYLGVTNYYEIAILSVGLLLFFSLCILYMSPMRRRAIVLTILCLFLLCCPYVSKVIGMRSTTQRWTFVLQLAEIFAIGFALQYLASIEDGLVFRKTVAKGMLLSDALFCLIFLGIWFVQSRVGISINERIGVKLMLMLLVYNLVFILPYLMIDTKASFPRIHKLTILAMVLVLLADTVSTDHTAINTRSTISLDDWYHDMYYDGTRTLTDWIQSTDEGLYRIAKSYESVSRNDSLVQNYKGVAVYNSLNTYWLVHYYQTMGYEVSNTQTSTGSNYIRFTYSDLTDDALLGVRYIITRSDQSPLLTGWELYRDLPALGYKIYTNPSIDSFGYFYDKQMDLEEYFRYNARKNKGLLTSGYFLTEDADAFVPDENAEASKEDTAFYGAIDLMGAVIFTADCSLQQVASGIVLFPTGDDMRMMFDTTRLPDGADPLYLEIELTAEEDDIFQIFISDADDDYTMWTFPITAGTGTYFLRFTNIDGMRHLRFDPTNVSQLIMIHSMSLSYQYTDKLADSIRALYQNGSVDLHQDGKNIAGTVDNYGSDARMLCVPVIYNNRWEALLDGEPAEIQNINGGLIGLEVPAGAHTLSLSYRYEASRIGREVGAVSFAVYVAMVLVYEFICTAVQIHRKKKAAAAQPAPAQNEPHS